MFNLLLVCSGGYTSSMLARKLEQYIRQCKLPYTIKSTNVATGLQICRNYDLTVLSPQVSFTFELFEKKMKISGRKPILLDKEDYFFANAEKVIQQVEVILSSVEDNLFRVAFVHGKAESAMFEDCYKGVQHLVQSRKLRFEVGFYAQNEIFKPDFDCDLIVFGFSFFKGNPNLQRGFFGERQIPFFILHQVYMYRGEYDEVIRQIFLEYARACKNLELP